MIDTDSNAYRLEQHRRLHNIGLPPMPAARDDAQLTSVDVSLLVNNSAIRAALVDAGWRPPSKPIDQPQCPTVAYQHPTSPDCVSTDPLAYPGSKELILKCDVMDHLDWLERGIDEWRCLAIDCQNKLAKAEA